MRISKDFVLQEFVCPEIYSLYGENALWFLDKRIIDVVQFIRNSLSKPIIINNWHTGGQYKDSGLRTLTSVTGAIYSQHKFGRAADIKCPELPAKELFTHIKQRFDVLKIFGLTTMEAIENTPSWVHIDTRIWGDDKLHIIKP